MELLPNYFLANVCKAPLAIYCKENTLLKQSNITLAALIAVMNVFQQIYRPRNLLLYHSGRIDLHPKLGQQKL
jgi:hypothetical protein